MQSRILDCVEQREADGKRTDGGGIVTGYLLPKPPRPSSYCAIWARLMPPPDWYGSLREHLVDGAEGLHLEYPSNGFVGSDRKIAVHTLLMEALSAPGNTDEKEQEGLCRLAVVAEAFAGLGDYHEQHGCRVCLDARAETGFGLALQ